MEEGDGFLLNPLGPLSIRWAYLPRLLPWLLRYMASGATRERIAVTARCRGRGQIMFCNRG